VELSGLIVHAGIILTVDKLLLMAGLSSLYTLQLLMGVGSHLTFGLLLRLQLRFFLVLYALVGQDPMLHLLWRVYIDFVLLH